MYAGFPVSLLSLLRCPSDQKELHLEKHQGEHLVVAGSLRCGFCGQRFLIQEGIVILLQPGALGEEGCREQHERDEISRRLLPEPKERRESDSDRMEMAPTLRAIDIRGGQRILEYGCGTGRYTVPLVKAGAVVLAMDFSVESLRVLAGRLSDDPTIGLVQADVAKPCVAPRSFERVLSTLVSNLSSREQRLAMLCAAADALMDSGRLVFSTHHQNFIRRWLGRPPAGRYTECAIYRYYMERKEVLRESRVYFGQVKCRPIQVALPCCLWSGMSPVTFSQVAACLPLIRQCGALLLVEATHPIRSPGEGEAVRANVLFSVLYSLAKKVHGRSRRGASVGRA